MEYNDSWWIVFFGSLLVVIVWGGVVCITVFLKLGSTCRFDKNTTSWHLSHVDYFLIMALVGQTFVFGISGVVAATNPHVVWLITLGEGLMSAAVVCSAACFIRYGILSHSETHRVVSLCIATFWAFVVQLTVSCLHHSALESDAPHTDITLMYSVAVSYYPLIVFTLFGVRDGDLRGVASAKV